MRSLYTSNPSPEDIQLLNSNMLAQCGDKKTINNSDTLKMDSHATNSILQLFYSPIDRPAQNLITTGQRQQFEEHVATPTSGIRS
jgi:hypothetical protein